MRRNKVSTGGKNEKGLLSFLCLIWKKMRSKFHISRKVMFFRKMEKNDNINVQDISIKDVILILLYADSNYKITGRFMFVKEAFLLTNRFFPDVFSKLAFYPSHYGPYSKLLLELVEQYSREGLINIEEFINAYGGDSCKYSLTEMGKAAASASFEKLPALLKEAIGMKRTAWDRMGYSGILRLVYSEYPEYTINSKIADKV